MISSQAESEIAQRQRTRVAGISSAGSVSVSPSTVISTSSISEYDLVSLWCCGGPTRTEPAKGETRSSGRGVGIVIFGVGVARDE